MPGHAGRPTASPAPAVELDGVARRFGRRWALRGVSLRVSPGEVVAIVGHNGSGKSTLLRVVATLLHPTLGGGTVYGHDLVREAAAVRACVGLLGATPGLYDDLTGAENLRFALRMLGRPATPAAVDEALAGVGLAGEGGERVRNYSSGMQRRLSLARVRLLAPRLLLLDEPYNSFDLDGVDRVNALVAETRERGGAVLLVAHDAERAAGLVDRVVAMEAGRVVDEPTAPATVAAHAAAQAATRTAARTAGRAAALAAGGLD